VNLSVKFTQDMDLAISVMRNAGEWLLGSGKNSSKWWQPQNMNREFLLRYANPEEFYAGLVDEKPGVAAILQFDQRNQDWTSVNKNQPQKALYIHWLCVHRQFASKGLPKIMIDFATKKALENNFKDSKKRWAMILNAGKIKACNLKNGKKVYYQAVGMEDNEAEEIIQLSSTHSDIPEPLRVAHLIAGAIVKGESSGRA
jgi:hypothetical protein